MTGEDERHLLAAIALARQAREKGNHPFGAVLADAHGELVLEAENTVVTARLHRPRGEQPDAQGQRTLRPRVLAGLHALHEYRAVRDVRRRHLLGQRPASRVRTE